MSNTSSNGKSSVSNGCEKSAQWEKKRHLPLSTQTNDLDQLNEEEKAAVAALLVRKGLVKPVLPDEDVEDS